MTLSCLSDGKTTSLSRTIHTGTLPPAPITTVDPDLSSVDALLVGSDIGSDHTRLIVGVFSSNSGAAYNLSYQNGSWNAPLKLGGNYTFYPRGAVVTQALAGNNFVYQARTFGIAMNLSAPGSPGPMQEVTNQSFSTPASLGGLFTSATAVASAVHDSLDVFGLGTDSNLYHKHITDAVTQSNWAQIGLNFTGTPVAVVSTSGLIELLAIRHGDLEVLHATFNPATNAISAWKPTNGRVYANLSACSRTPGTLDVVVLGTDYSIYTSHFDGSSWGGWISLGGKSLRYRRPAICSWSPSRLDVCVVGTDNGYYHRWWDGTSWNASGWESLGLKTSVGGGLYPSMVAVEDGHLILFGGDAQHNVVSRDLIGATWSPWITHTGAPYL